MTDATIDGLSAGELATVVELQRAELDRVHSDQRRLNDRIDLMLRLQKREQVLRQQMQAALDRLAEGTSIPAPVEQADTLQITDRLQKTERKFSALQSAVGQLVLLIDRTQRPKPAGS